MEELTEEPGELVERVAALDIGKASLVCCVRVPHESRPGGRRQEVRSYDTITPALLGTAGLTDLPGCVTTAQEIIAETRALDMTRFPTHGHLVSWAKFAPKPASPPDAAKPSPPARATPGSAAPSAKAPQLPPGPAPSWPPATSGSSSAGDGKLKARSQCWRLPTAVRSPGLQQCRPIRAIVRCRPFYENHCGGTR